MGLSSRFSGSNPESLGSLAFGLPMTSLNSCQELAFSIDLHGKENARTQELGKGGCCSRIYFLSWIIDSASPLPIPPRIFAEPR